MGRIPSWVFLFFKLLKIMRIKLKGCVFRIEGTSVRIVGKEARRPPPHAASAELHVSNAQSLADSEQARFFWPVENRLRGAEVKDMQHTCPKQPPEGRHNQPGAASVALKDEGDGTSLVSAAEILRLHPDAWQQPRDSPGCCLSPGSCPLVPG